MAKHIEIELSEEGIKELWEIKQKLKFPEDKEQTFEEFKADMKKQKLGCLFG